MLRTDVVCADMLMTYIVCDIVRDDLYSVCDMVMTCRVRDMLMTNVVCDMVMTYIVRDVLMT